MFQTVCDAAQHVGPEASRSCQTGGCRLLACLPAGLTAYLLGKLLSSKLARHRLQEEVSHQRLTSPPYRA